MSHRTGHLHNTNKGKSYTYDYFGNVTQVYYQGNDTSDKFYHHYKYDTDNRLSEVRTSKDGITKTLHARYEYYLHGPLKRVILANNLQGIDYTYTIDGALKSINHADPTKDPGGDGTNDVFGETLHYFDGDYQGAGYSAGTQTITGYDNQYGGLLKAMSWHSPAGNHSKQTYAYQYNSLNFLTNAVWGNMTGTSGTYNFSPGSADAYREAANNYDKHGNIGTMLRKGKVGNTLANYSYIYETNTNRLDKVNHNAVQMVDYSYNSIGQMTRQSEDGKDFEIYYNAYGLVKEIKKVNGSNSVTLQTYHYDDRNNLFQKVLHNSAGVPQKYTTYLRDVAGNVLAIYESDTSALPVQPVELPVYGAGRIAVYKPEANIYFYEISDHLGNVRAVIGSPITKTVSTNFETEADNEFQNYSHQYDELMDRTDAGVQLQPATHKRLQLTDRAR